MKGIAVNILHISDVHFGVNDLSNEQPYVTNAIIDAVAQVDCDINLCVFTGDLANKGLPDEYQKAEEWLSKLRDAIPNSDCKIVICPGNHDCDRSVAKVLELRGASSSPELFSQAVHGQGVSREHLRNFLNWHEKYKQNNSWVISDWTNDVNLVSIDINGITTNIVTANSALLSCGNDDAGKLCVDDSTLNSLLDRCNCESELTIFAMHHPLNGEWLTPWNEEKIKTILSQRRGGHACLTGHVHDASGHSFSNGEGQSLLELCAGASYGGTQWPQSFSLWQFKISEHSIVPKTYEFFEKSGRWTINNKISEPFSAKMPMLENKSQKTVNKYEKSECIETDYSKQNLLLLKIIRENGVLYPVNKNLFKTHLEDNLVGVTKFDSILRLPTNEEVKNIPDEVSVAGIALCIPCYLSFMAMLDCTFSPSEKDQILHLKFKRISDETKHKVVSVLNQMRQFGFIVSVSIQPSIFDVERSKIRIKATNTAILNILIRTIFENKSKAKLESVNILFNETGYDSLIHRRVVSLSEEELPRKTNVQTKAYTPNESFDFLNKFLKLTCWFVSAAESEKSLHWLDELIKV